MKDDHEERIEQLQERLEDMKRNMDEVEEELEIERRVKEREKIREEIRKEKAEQKGESYSKAKHVKKEEKREDRKAEKRGLFSSHLDDDDKFRYDDFEHKKGKGDFMDSIKQYLTVKNLITGVIVIGFLVALALFINYVVGNASLYKTNEGNLTAIQQLAGETSKQEADATSVKSEEKKEAAETKVEEIKVEENKTAATDIKTSETKTENKTSSAAGSTSSSSSSSASSTNTLTGGEAGKLTIEFDGTGIETDESKGWGRVVKIKYKIYNKKTEAVKPSTIEFILQEGETTGSAKKFTLPSTMQNLPANNEVAWSIDNKGATLEQYDITTTKLKVTLVLRDAAKKELARVAKEFDV